MILNKELPFTSTVKQHGTFEPLYQTYGSDRDFPKKYPLSAQKELFGPFRIGNLPKKGHEKTLAPFPRYIEDPPDDSLPKQGDGLVWRVPKVSTTTHWRPQWTTYINTTGQLRDYPKA
jgi:hypothetical protein